MNTRRLLGVIFLMLLEAEAMAHGLQFLLAKVTPTSHGTVKFEISADFTANPLINSEEMAQKAISQILVMHLGDDQRPLGQTGEIRFAKTQDIDSTCPMKIPPAPGGATHELLSGYLEEPVTTSSLGLRVPKGNPNDVVLWVMDEHGRNVPNQHYYLIAGDPVLSISMPAQRWNGWLLGGIGMIGLSLLGLFLRAKRQALTRASTPH